MLTSELVQPRILGVSETRKLPSTALVLFTGNNLVIKGDCVRRMLICRIEPENERPDQREFDFDPVDEVREARPELVAAALTVMRAYHCAGRPRPKGLKPVGSYTDWEDLIRGALVWLGCADPALTMDRLFDSEPEQNELIEVMDAWEAAFGADRVPVSAIPPVKVLADLLIEAAACPGGKWNSKSVSAWLKRHRGAAVGGRAFTPEKLSGKNWVWRLRGAADKAESTAAEPVAPELDADLL